MVSAGEGHGSLKVKVGGCDGSVSSESLTEVDIGTPVDDLISPVAAKAAFASPGPVKPLSENLEKASLSGHVQGLEHLTEEFNAPLATPESISKHAKVKGGPIDPVKPVSGPATNGGPSTSKEEPAVSNDSDRLTKISQAIDDFDPSTLVASSSNTKKNVEDNQGSVNFSKDINDESLIDDLLKDSDSNINDTKGDKGEVTSGKVTGSKSTESVDSSHVSVTDPNDLTDDKSPDGSMSASTESDGFQEDGVNGDVESKDEQAAPNEKPANSQPAQNKSGSQKSENMSPSKTSKSKKKEDKSIGRSTFLKLIHCVCFFNINQ